MDCLSMFSFVFWGTRKKLDSVHLKDIVPNSVATCRIKVIIDNIFLRGASDPQAVHRVLLYQKCQGLSRYIPTGLRYH